MGVGGADGLGLETLPAVWEYGDGEVGVLPAASVVFDGAASCAGAATHVPWVQKDVLGAVSLVGAGELVCARGASVCHRPLDAWQDVVAANGGVYEVVDRQAGAVCAVATFGGSASRGSMSFRGE